VIFLFPPSFGGRIWGWGRGMVRSKNKCEFLEKTFTLPNQVFVQTASTKLEKHD